MGGGSESKKQLGKILLQQRMVSIDALQEMLDEQKREPGSRLASTGARTGRLSMKDALRALGEQHGVPAVDLTEQIVALATMRLIPVEMAREHNVFPFRLDGEQLWLAMSSPDQAELIEELAFVTGKKIQAMVALHEVMRRVIEYAYAALDRGEQYYVGAHVTGAQLAALGLPDLPRAPEPLSAYPPPPGAEAPKAPPPPEAASPAPQPAAVAPIAPPVPVASPPAVAIAPAPLPVQAPAPAASARAAERQPLVQPALDVAFAERMPPSQPPARRAQESEPSVLVAVSDAQLRAALRQTLHAIRLGVVEAETGAHALDAIVHKPPRFLLVGTGLASMAGLELVRRVRANPDFTAIAIAVLCDAYGGWRLASDLRDNFGIQHFFEAPFDLVKLGQTVQLVCDGQAAVDDAPPPLSARAEARWSGGMAAFERGDLDSAIVELEAGAELEPNAFELQYHLGLLYGRREDLFAAIRALEHAVSLQPRHFAAVKNLAVVYQRAGFRRKALDAWERATVAAPDDETRTNIRQHMISLMSV